jgi:hypothetical protein
VLRPSVGLLALLLAVWLAAAPEPDSGSVEGAPWISPPGPAAPHSVAIRWVWTPEEEACASGRCLALPRLETPPAFPTLARGDGVRWDINVTLEGHAQPGDLVPTLLVQAARSEEGQARAADGACSACGGGGYRTLAQVSGALPLHLGLPGAALASGETELRVAVFASAPPGATGIVAASTWQLSGSATALPAS